MKELLTKTFWRDVKKTFDAARAGTTPGTENSQATIPDDAKTDMSPTQVPSPPEAPKP